MAALDATQLVVSTRTQEYKTPRDFVELFFATRLAKTSNLSNLFMARGNIRFLVEHTSLQRNVWSVERN